MSIPIQRLHSALPKILIRPASPSIQGQLTSLQFTYWSHWAPNNNILLRAEGSLHTFHPTWNVLVTSKSNLDREPWGKLACDPVLICCLRQFLCRNNILWVTDTGNLTADAEARKKCHTRNRMQRGFHRQRARGIQKSGGTYNFPQQNLFNCL